MNNKTKQTIAGNEQMEDEEIIDLTDKVLEAKEDNDTVIELTDIANTSLIKDDDDSELSEQTDDMLENSIELDDKPDKDLYIAQGIEDDFVESMGIDISGASEINEEEKAEPVQLTLDQIEKAVERVIEKKFSDRIESIIYEAIQKAVTKEIDRIKSILLEDTDNTENI